MADIAGDAFTAGRTETSVDSFDGEGLALNSLAATKQMPTSPPSAIRVPKVAPKTFADFRRRRESLGGAFFSIVEGRRPSLFMGLRENTLHLVEVNRDNPKIMCFF